MEELEEGGIPYTMTPKFKFLNSDHISMSLSPMRAAGMFSKKRGKGKGRKSTDKLTVKPFEILKPSLLRLFKS
jgi:hypothetical protein